MLGEDEEDEEDNHLCLRCNAKIIGLGNYVEHRKSFCSTTKLINKTREVAVVGGGGEEDRSQNKGIVVGSAGSEIIIEIGAEKTTTTNETQFKAIEASSSSSNPHHDHHPSLERAAQAAPSFDSSYDDQQSSFSHSKTVLEKSLDFNLADYDIIDGEAGPGSPTQRGSGSRTEGDYDYEGASLFFSSLQLQSSSKREVGGGGKRAPEIILDHHHQSSRLTTDSGKLHRSADGEDHLAAVRPSALYQQLEGFSDDSIDEEDENYGASYLEEQEFDTEEDEEDYRAPPRTHTGGKWKPDDRPMATTSRPVTNSNSPSTAFSWPSVKSTGPENVVVVVNRQPSEDEGDYPSCMSPPLNYTRGKWIPGGKEIEQSRRDDGGGTSISPRRRRCSTESPQPVPLIREQILGGLGGGGGVATNKSLWCSVCNRTLASELIFQRHLASNLHKKRAMLETELEQARQVSRGGGRVVVVAYRGGDNEGEGEKSRQSSRGGPVFQMPSIRGPELSRQSTGGGAAAAVVISKEVVTASKGFGGATTTGAVKRKRSSLINISSEANCVDEEDWPIDGDSLSRRGQRMRRVDNYSPVVVVKGAKKEKGAGKLKKKRVRRRTYTMCPVCKIRLRIALMGRHLLSHMHYRRMQLNRNVDQRLVLDYFDQIVRLSPFQCQICSFFTTTPELFMCHWESGDHQRRVVEKGVLRMWCSFCKFEGGVDEMKGHLTSEGHREVIQALNRTHPIIIREKIVMSCVRCDSEFSSNLGIRRHKCGGGQNKMNVVNTASDEYQSIYKCQDCGEVFRRLTVLRRHKKEKHSRIEFHCFRCKLSFGRKEEAVKHRLSWEHKLTVAKLDGKQEPKRSCKQCQLEFSDLGQLKAHMTELHEQEKFSCLLCGATFDVAQALSHHVRKQLCGNVPANPIEAIPGLHASCLVCPFKTTSEAELLFHKAVLHDNPDLTFDSKAKFKCPLCGKLFRKAILIGHLRKHTNEKLFVCPHCPSRYTRKAALVEHMSKCHRAPASDTSRAAADRGKKFKCRFEGCSYETTSNQNLKKHPLVHLGKNFACDKCSYRTKEANSLKRHSFTHSEEKPFPCPKCSNAFKCNSNMRKHFINAHVGHWLYNCDKCRFKTNLNADLRNHKCESGR